MHPKRNIGSRGFTLIEIVVVVAIIGILALLIGPRVIGRADEARVTETTAQIKTIETALKLFKLDNGFYPSTEQGLSALVKKPDTGRIPERYREGGYLDGNRVPEDAWGNPFIYGSPGLNGPYDLLSYGGDGVPGGEGTDKDIESWNLR